MTLDQEDVQAIVAFVRQASFAGATSFLCVTRATGGHIRELDAAELAFRNAVINTTNQPKPSRDTMLCDSSEKRTAFHVKRALLPCGHEVWVSASAEIGMRACCFTCVDSIWPQISNISEPPDDVPRSSLTYVNANELADLRKLHGEVRDLIFNSNGFNLTDVPEIWKRVGAILSRLEGYRKPGKP